VATKTQQAEIIDITWEGTIQPERSEILLGLGIFIKNTLRIFDFESPPRISQAGLEVEVELVACRHKKSRITVALSCQPGHGTTLGGISVPDQDVVSGNF
jgi:hypothetical protein